jgi:hypothetical protein
MRLPFDLHGQAVHSSMPISQQSGLGPAPLFKKVLDGRHFSFLSFTETIVPLQLPEQRDRKLTADSVTLSANRNLHFEFSAI